MCNSTPTFYVFVKPYKQLLSNCFEEKKISKELNNFLESRSLFVYLEYSVKEKKRQLSESNFTHYLIEVDHISSVGNEWPAKDNTKNSCIVCCICYMYQRKRGKVWVDLRVNDPSFIFLIFSNLHYIKIYSKWYVLTSLI